MSVQSSEDDFGTARSESVTPVYLSPVVRRFRENRYMARRRLERMLSRGLLPQNFSTSAQMKTVFEMKKYANMRDTEEKLQRLEIMERLLKIKSAGSESNTTEQDVSTLTAMYLELGRGLGDEEFMREVDDAAVAGKTFDHKLMEKTLPAATKPENRLPDVVVRRIPVHLIEGYCEGGMNLVVTKSKISLRRDRKRKIGIPKKYSLPIC